MVTAIKHYASYILVLAAVVCASCQRAQETSQSTGTAAASSDAGSASETEVPASSTLWVQLQKDLDSSKLKTGDHFSGTIAEDVVLNGKPVIPKGSSVKGRVTNSATANTQGNSGLLSLVLDSVTIKGTSYNLITTPTTLQGPTVEQNLPTNDKSNKAVSAAASAFAPKHGILQFFLANAVKVKS